jgi:glycosyltransferase involved in cell wall biosynthesis
MNVGKKHKISIIIPFYNGEIFLGELLKSLSESFLKSLKLLTVEIIIINDSPRVSEQEIRSIYNPFVSENFDIKLFSNSENKGVAYSRDLGTIRASGDFITWIDQDDFVHQTYFSILEKRLQSEQKIYLLNGYICKNNRKNTISVFYIKPTINFARILFDNPVLSTSFWVINRDFLNEQNIRFYLPEQVHKGIDDWFFSLQLTQKTLNIEYIAARLIYYRFHENNFGHDIVEAIDGCLVLLKLLQSDHTFPKNKLRTRAKTLEFSKRFYTTNKIFCIFSEPVNFIRFLVHYCYDPNRLIRLIHKMFRRIKIRP